MSKSRARQTSMRPALAAVVARIAEVDRLLDELDRAASARQPSGAQALGFEQIELAGSVLAIRPTNAAEALALVTLLATEVDARDEDPRSAARIERGFGNLRDYLEAAAGVTAVNLGLSSYLKPAACLPIERST